MKFMLLGFWVGMAFMFVAFIVTDEVEHGCRWLDKGLVAWTNVVKLP